MTHQIIFLLAAPRSGSTITELAFENTGYFDLVLHEPNADCYYKRREKLPPGTDPAQMDFLDYQGFKDKVLAAAQTGRVFVKDMVHYFYDDIANDKAFANQIDFIFLIRQPLQTIQSYLSKDPNVSSEEIGFEAMWRFTHCLKNWGQDYQIVDYEQIVRQPEETFFALCTQIKLPFKPGMHLVKAQEDFKHKTAKFQDWHAVALASTRIEAKLSEYKLSADHPRVQELLALHQGYYDMLKAEIISMAPKSTILNQYRTTQIPPLTEVLLDTRLRLAKLI